MLVFKHLLNRRGPVNPDKTARLFKLLSVGARVKIVRLLKDRVLCVGAMAARLDMSSAAVSQHLRILRDAGLVEPEKRGYFVHYRLNARKLAECRRVMDALLSLAKE